MEALFLKKPEDIIGVFYLHLPDWANYTELLSTLYPAQVNPSHCFCNKRDPSRRKRTDAASAWSKATWILFPK